MTVIDKFFNWQSSGLDFDAPLYERCAPGLDVIEDYVLTTWGGANLGCHGDRAIVGGQSPSSHAYGAAWDWRYAAPSAGAAGRWPGRDLVLVEVLPFLIGHSAELGLQAIHDYLGCRIWRPPGHSGRPADGDGWKAQQPASQMGQSWAVWLHLELHPDAWNDTRPIPERITVPAAPVPVPPSTHVPPPDPGPFPPGEPNVVNITVATIRRGSTGGWVRKAQAILAANFNQPIPADGAFGAKTEDAIRDVQRLFGLTVDGVCGPKTWGVLLGVAP